MEPLKRYSKQVIMAEIILASICGIIGGTVDLIYFEPDFKLMIALIIVIGVIGLMRVVIHHLTNWINGED